ncbi:uncharacterized protein HMPREF1541_10142 [Cyphellophora europaea CBS 101466]|uniref:Uncharacterized protein n=1 Tax=Cyphellophora europaea (strain CBS 101466) TaxID=1220924 RepID=W2S722_CYPE1|nr:uncharacterized protein HMPREF1541_10142 [Cyphellophora europaea CBS 101466]ETN44472.1 hypothetical protein HMPREF1541_10142 [Cyphellophora europaea CBS 101466]
MTTRYEDFHRNENLGGPGDSRPTAQQIVDYNDLVGKWTDKVILVTGTSSGLGITTVAALKSTGAKIYATARNLDKGRNALKRLLEPGRVELLQLDTGDLSSVRACATEFLSRESKLNVLINNAGVMAIEDRRLTKDGFEEQFAVNYLGHFLLFLLLKPALLAAASPEFGSRVINVSSSTHKVASVNLDNLNFDQDGSYDRFVGYGQAKTAQILMTNEIERRYAAQGLHSLALNPGAIDTPLQVHIQTMVDELKKNWEIRKTMKDVEQGSATTLVAAVDKEVEGKGGLYLNDCAIQEPTDNHEMGGGGVARHALDEVLGKKLWNKGIELVGFQE